MIPSECQDDTKSRAEIGLFYELKKQIPDDWVIFHSFSLLNRTQQKKIIDAEIDFIVLAPQFGLMVLEVKGGHISFKDGIWQQNGWKIISPARQAMNNKYALLSYLKRSLPSVSLANFAHAICFPDIYELEEVPAECEGICITGKEIPYLKEAIKKIFSDFSVKNSIEHFDYNLILKKLSPVFEYGISLSENLKQSERKIFTLTEQQCELLNFISEHKRALIKGCAGSGKTIMAMKKAAELAENGLTVLLLVYNSLLCEKLKFSLGDKTNVKVITFHDLCIETLRNNGIELNPRRSDDKIWTETLPSKFMALLKKKPMKFDAVIIDEGQDFNINYWESVSELVKDDGYFFIFYDPDQNLFNKELSLPKLGTPFILNKNCRNSQEIFNFLKPYCSGNPVISDFAPRGNVKIFYEESDTKRREILIQILNDLLEQKIYERQIVILGGHSMRKTCIGDNPILGKFEIVENNSHDILKIPYFTYMKYKGCEADVVILLDVSVEDSRWKKEALCTAISRAKHLLFIISKSSKINHDN